ncbi:MAG: radical SAM protein [Deltaproteobacteria bacterium]|nr:radical SAM protein [Deltaproteobacteria bacterium]
MPANLAEILPRVPVSCFWEITDACNLRCIHCEADAGRKSPDELSTAEALSLADQLAEVGCERVCLTGGEPLLRSDWPTIAARLSDRGLNVTVITNGMLVDPPAIERMVEVGVHALSVSIDGDRAVHDAIRLAAGRSQASSYDGVLRAIELSAASPLKTAAITQIHRANIDDLPRMYEQMVELGVDAWQVQICMPLGRLLKYRHQYLIDPAQLPDLHSRLAELVEDGRMPVIVADNIGYYGRQEPTLRRSAQGTKSFWCGCMAGCRVVAFCANGDVKGCPSHPREFVVGNIRERPLAEIWGEPERFAYNTAFDETLLTGGCARCPFRKLCRAGCTSMAYAVTGTIYDNPFCIQRVQGEDAEVEVSETKETAER